MKLRIIIRDSREEPYLLQVKHTKWNLFWKDVATFRNLESAEHNMKAYVPPKKPGTVLAEYTDEDRLVDKLKGVK